MGLIPRRSEFRELFESHREPVFRLLWRLSGNPHDAEDLLQETFVTYWRKRRQFRGEGSLLGYLRKIAFRTFLNSRARLSAKRPPLPLLDQPDPAEPGPEKAVDDEDTRRFLLQRVREALDTLPDGAREAFVLFRYEGMTVREVAETVEAPLKTVESRLRRAKQLLTQRLARYRDHLTAY
jgi:RNA polymerase sigma-70 factor (ECF subfamily)